MSKKFDGDIIPSIMLKFLRKKGVMKKVIWFVAILIIISFGFLGTAYLITDSIQSKYAGRLFGKKIALDDYFKSLKSIEIQSIIRYGDNFKNIRQYLNLESEAWDRLILLHEVKKRKITVADEKVIEAIEKYAFFQREEKFDSLLYNDILRFVFRVEPRAFEESTRETLKFNKLYKEITEDAKITDQEIFDNYKQQNEKVQISYVYVDPKQFKDTVAIEETQYQQHYSENKLDFLAPPSINVNYLSFYFPEEKIKETIENETDAETKTKPNEESEENKEPEVDPELEKNPIREKAHTIYQELLLTPNLDEISAKNNLKVQSSGFFSMEKPNLSLGWSYDLLNSVFQMDTNEISEPFETNNGLYIVKVTEKKEAYVPEFEDIQDEVKEKVVRIETKILAGKKAEEHVVAIKEEVNKTKLKDFAKSAKILGLEIHQTPEFNRGQYLPTIGISHKFQEAAFELTEENPISDVVETENGYAILHLDTIIPVKTEDFDKEKKALAEKLLNEQRNKTFNEFLTRLRLKAKLIDNISEKKE